MDRSLRIGAAALAVILWSLIPAAAQQTQRQPGASAVTAKRAPVAAPLKPAMMKVRHVRSNQPGCEPDCPEWISAEGQIDATTPAEFRRVLARLGDRKLPILIDSPGGSLDPSFAIARMIRAKGLDVVVTKTVLSPCEPGDKDCLRLRAKGIDLGRPEAKISKCASSCAFILAGGVRRYVGSWTVVGLHEIRAVHTMRLVRQHYRIERPMFAPARKQIVKQETLWSNRVEGPADEKVYERVKSFFAEMGVSDAIMPILRSAPNTSIRWVRYADLNATRLATHFINGEELLHPPKGALANAAIPPPVPAPMPAPIQPLSTAPSAAQTTAAASSAPPAVATAQPQPAAQPTAGAQANASASAVQPAAAAAAEPAKPKVVARAKPKPRSSEADTQWRPF